MMTKKRSTQQTVRDIRRATRRHYSAEEKIRIVLEGLRGEDSIAELCRREGINSNVYYRWSKEFLEAGKKRLSLMSKLALRLVISLNSCWKITVAKVRCHFLHRVFPNATT